MTKEAGKSTRRRRLEDGGRMKEEDEDDEVEMTRRIEVSAHQDMGASLRKCFGRLVLGKADQVGDGRWRRRRLPPSCTMRPRGQQEGRRRYALGIIRL